MAHPFQLPENIADNISRFPLFPPIQSEKVEFQPALSSGCLP